MDKVHDTYWAAYEHALDMKISAVLKKVAAINFKDSDYLIKKVKEECAKTFYPVELYRESFMVVVIMLDNQDFNGLPTNDVYDLYSCLCKEVGFKIIAKEEFTRFINRYFGYTVMDKKCNGIKRRIYIKL